MNPFAKHGIQHLSPSSLNLFAACPALWVMERLMGRRGPVGAAAHRGTAVEEGVAKMLTDGITADEATTLALTLFDKKTALSGDPKRDKERASIADMIPHAYATLAPWGKPSATQQRVEWRPEGLAVPIIGILDFYYQDTNTVLDLKTAHKLPSEIKTGHARQVALYQGALGDNSAAGLAYVTGRKGQVLRLEHGCRHKDALAAMARALGNFLDRVDDAEDAARLLVPDTDSFYFADPATRQAAYEVFGV